MNITLDLKHIFKYAKTKEHERIGKKINKIFEQRQTADLFTSKDEEYLKLRKSIAKSLSEMKSSLKGEREKIKSWESHIDSKDSFTLSAGITPIELTDSELGQVKSINQGDRSPVEVKNDFNHTARKIYERIFEQVDDALYDAKENGRSALVINDGYSDKPEIIRLEKDKQN